MMWTTRQEEIVREQCHRGSRAVRDAIERECGVRRTVRAVEAHASRMHVSLKVRSECPQCGAIGVRLNRQTGMCPLCTEELHVEEGRAFNELLRREVEGCEEGPELDAAWREYVRMRQQNSRLMRSTVCAANEDGSKGTV